jgi:hypothetical protein
MEDMRLITSIRRPNVVSTIFWTKDFYAAATKSREAVTITVGLKGYSNNICML